ncbi:sugar kinase [Geodermatophilus maliterrae]|uniref:Sugar kinase n=1 Tax=Geodermatophilus maliterrae TaxID=3162531 RepID=A0ABV3XB63_9ACTN
MSTGQDLTGPDVVTVGEPLVQLSPPSGRRLQEAGTLDVHTAGAEMNVAVGLARLGHRCAFVGRVGADPFGARILDELRGAGVDVSAVRRDPVRPTGVYLKDHDRGTTSVYYYREGSAAAAMGPADLGSVAASPRWFHVTGITAALSASCAALLDDLLAARPGRARISFDVNHRPGLWPDARAGQVLLDLARRADLVFVGRDEAARLWGTDTADDVRRLLPEVPVLVVKDAAAAATSMRGRQVTTVASLPVPVVEAVGAGDAFAAGYLSATLAETDERTALRRGHLFAARALLSVADQVEPPPPDLLADAADRDDSWWGGAELLQHPYLRGRGLPVVGGRPESRRAVEPQEV